MKSDRLGWQFSMIGLHGPTLLRTSIAHQYSKKIYTPEHNCEYSIHYIIDFHLANTMSFYKLQPPDHRRETKHRVPSPPPRSPLYPQRDS